MAKWVPLTALLGLVCLMIIPTPGVMGIVIGAVCALAILMSALLMLIDRLAGQVAAMTARMRQNRSSARRRAVHAQSGMAKKV